MKRVSKVTSGLFGKRLVATLVALVCPLALTPSVRANDAVEAVLKEAQTKFKGVKEGKNADYIPALAEVPSKLFGISLVTVGGKVYDEGDTKSLFSIQSISKVFTLALVLQESG